jgi:hypothetical protein
MTVHELSQLILEWIWERPKPLQDSFGLHPKERHVLPSEVYSFFEDVVLAASS